MLDKEIVELTKASGELVENKLRHSRQASKLKNFLVKCGFKNVKHHQGYLFASAHATSASGRVWYFHVDDERGGCMPNNPLLMRTALDYEDYSGRGGNNQYPHTVREVKEAAQS